MDVYRLGSLDEALSAGIEETIHTGGVVVLEWADRWPEILPEHTLTVMLLILDEHRRTIILSGRHARSFGIIDQLRRRCPRTQPSSLSITILPCGFPVKVLSGALVFFLSFQSLTHLGTVRLPAVFLAGLAPCAFLSIWGLVSLCMIVYIATIVFPKFWDGSREGMALIVQKYGGTSVGTIEKIRNVAKRVLEDHKKGNAMVWFSPPWPGRPTA